MMDRDKIGARVGEAQTLLNAISPVWPLLAEELLRMRTDHVDRLIAQNSEELRGAVKFIDELLRLPNNLRQESLNLAKSLSEPDD